MRSYIKDWFTRDYSKDIAAVVESSFCNLIEWIYRQPRTHQHEMVMETQNYEFSYSISETLFLFYLIFFSSQLFYVALTW